MPEPLLFAEIGPARLEVCVADITTLALMRSSTPPIVHCLAVAESMAPSIAPPGRNS
jgi:hypothetical protein